MAGRGVVISGMAELAGGAVGEICSAENGDGDLAMGGGEGGVGWVRGF